MAWLPICHNCPVACGAVLIVVLEIALELCLLLIRHIVTGTSPWERGIGIATCRGRCWETVMIT